jgi:hypothetical protein
MRPSSVTAISVLMVWRFFLARIPATLFSAWPLDRLFRAVYNQGLDLLSTDADHALHPENLPGHSFDPPQVPADG